jgi:hypothetical protein
MNYIGYLRLGTAGSKVTPEADLARQREELLWWIKKSGGRQVGEFIVEKRAEEGALIAEALQECRRLRARLVIPSLSRPRQARDLMDALIRAQTQFVVIRVTDEPTRRLIELLNASAKRNQEQRAQRAKDSVKVGNPHGTRRDGTPALSKEAQAKGREVAAKVRQQKADAFALKLQPVIKELMEGAKVGTCDGKMTRYAVAEELNLRKTKTASGKVGKWDERKVARVLDRKVVEPYVLEANWKKGWKKLRQDQNELAWLKQDREETVKVNARSDAENFAELDRLGASGSRSSAREAIRLLKRWGSGGTKPRSGGPE